MISPITRDGLEGPFGMAASSLKYLETLFFFLLEPGDTLDGSEPLTNTWRTDPSVPRGTRIPTEPNLWRRRLVPTCSLGEPERIFKLVICEIGRNSGDERRFSWDADGQLRALGGEQSEGDIQLVVPLNESNPTLGTLNPPHPPSDQRPLNENNKEYLRPATAQGHK